MLCIDSLAPVTNLVVNKLTNASFNISWTPVFAYEGLTVYYNISINGTIRTGINSNIEVFTTEMDQCQFLSVSITPFINETDQILMNHNEWRLPIESEIINS